MSRTRKSSGGNSPVKRYISFSGSNGKVKYFDKQNPNANSKGQVELDNLDFILLDVKSSISGYNEKTESGISSNLVNPMEIKKVPLNVKTKMDGKFGTFVEGLYDDIKDKVGSIGGKFTTNLFALADVGEGMEIVRIELNGSSLTPWIELMDKIEDEDDDVYNHVISISQGTLMKRGKGKNVKVTKKEVDDFKKALAKDSLTPRPVWFYTPEFSISDLSEEDAELAVEADNVLQEYFDKVNGVESETMAVKESSTAESPQPAPETEDEYDDLPF